MKTKVTATEEAKSLKTIITEELLGSLITHKSILEKGQKVKAVDKKKKRDLALHMFMGDDDVDMTLVTRNFNIFLKNRTVAKKVDKRGENLNLLSVRVLTT